MESSWVRLRTLWSKTVASIVHTLQSILFVVFFFTD